VVRWPPSEMLRKLPSHEYFPAALRWDWHLTDRLLDILDSASRLDL